MTKRKPSSFEIIVGIATIVSGVAAILVVPEIRQWIGLEQVFPSLIPTPTAIIIPTATLTKQPQVSPTATATAEYPCPFSEKNAEASITNIVSIESLAAINEDIYTLELVYFADATISDNGQVWHNPIVHYEWVFTDYDILAVSNSDVRIEFISDESAIVYRTASGRTKNRTTLEIGEYTDNSGWLLFKKDDNGCWRISRFDKAPDGYK